MAALLEHGRAARRMEMGGQLLQGRRGRALAASTPTPRPPARDGWQLSLSPARLLTPLAGLPHPLRGGVAAGGGVNALPLRSFRGVLRAARARPAMTRLPFHS